MARQSSSSGRRAQGGGRTPNSEPRMQVFKGFSGVNFENALMDPIDPNTWRNDDMSYQSDLQMNFMHLQDNVATTSNQTMETRDDLVHLFKAASNTSFTGPVKLIGNKLYVAMHNSSTLADNIGIADIDTQAGQTAASTISSTVRLSDATGSGHEWTSLDYYDNKLIALTKENEIWTGDVNSSFYVSSISNCREVPDPPALTMSNLQQKGSLRISQTMTDACPFRIDLTYAYVNKFGPTNTEQTQRLTFYANHPVSEWHAGCYLRISGTCDRSTAGNESVIAVELYYATDNAMDMIFLGRYDFPNTTRSAWAYNWFGYIDATSMWPVANLIAPIENYTKGVHASRVCNIDGRMYFWGDSSNKQRLYIGGNPGNLFSISPGTGGGFVDVEPGTNQAVKHVCKYKTQSGNSIVTMLCSSPNTKKDQRYNLVDNNISLSNEQSMHSWYAEQVAGAVGCMSYDGVVVCQDGLYSVNRYGLALTTMTMEYNSQIRTTYVSDPIKPAFTDAIASESRLENSILLECDGIIYLALGKGSDGQGNLDKMIFCYDIDRKAWWTYSFRDLSEQPILNLFHIDWHGQREGIGIVTAKNIYLLPTTVGDDYDEAPGHVYYTMETGQISTQQPQQQWQWLSQLEFRFDYFIGDMEIRVRMIDMFGRKIDVEKTVSSEDVELYNHTVHMRIDQRVQSYVISFRGKARFRMTHFIARVYTLSNKVGQVWGFDDSITYRDAGDIQPTFKCYNDVRKAIFT